MIIITSRTILGHAIKFDKRRYCKNTFDFLSNPIRISTKRSELTPSKKLNKNLVLHLERISLVSFSGERSTKILEDAISYADQLEELNTDGVEPLFMVLENESLYVREDTVKKDVKTYDLLSHSERTCEGYFVTPIESLENVTGDEKKEQINITDFNENIENSMKF